MYGFLFLFIHWQMKSNYSPNFIGCLTQKRTGDMKTKVALALSGGGARGIAHIGVIEELEKRNFEITSISGTSMGALVGGVYALGKMEEFKDWLFRLDKKKVFSLVDFTLSKQGLVKGDRVLNTIKEFIKDANIEDLPIPYCAVATDIINRKEVVFTKGSIYEAIHASLAIPTIFTPVKTESGLFVDGGVVNNLPLNQVKRTKGDLLIGSYVNAKIEPGKLIEEKKETEERESRYMKKIREFQHQLLEILPFSREESLGYFDLINNTISLMTHRISDLTLQQHKPDHLIKVSRDVCSMFDFYKAEELVEIGRQAAKEYL